MKIKYVKQISEIGKTDWNKLVSNESLFLKYEFLSALETYGCVGEQQGWLPYHQVVENDEEVVAVMPLYLKYNSYGELVFDWSWADAYERAGRQYYPKLVSTIPYTPVTGTRLCVRDDVNQDQIKALMIEALTQTAQDLSLSSIHCLFPKEVDISLFESQGYYPRLACQFHWQNQNYESFDHFLSFLSSRKRKNIRRERARVVDEGIEFQTLSGCEVEEDLWPIIYQLYRKTFLDKGGYATFTLEFFKQIGKTMGENLLITLAIHQGKYVAGAICYRDKTHLYGRHWGCFEDFHSLHFETCYYQGLEYAIDHGLQYFDPGAQGEHKLQRGFLPTQTWSAHWIKDDDFSQVIGQFVEREYDYMRQYIDEMSRQSPYKKQGK